MYADGGHFACKTNVGVGAAPRKVHGSARADQRARRYSRKGCWSAAMRAMRRSRRIRYFTAALRFLRLLSRPCAFFRPFCIADQLKVGESIVHRDCFKVRRTAHVRRMENGRVTVCCAAAHAVVLQLPPQTRRCAVHARGRQSQCQHRQQTVLRVSTVTPAPFLARSMLVN